MNRLFVSMLICVWVSCIGTDELEDPIVGARIETPFSQVGLLIGDTTSVSATYFDQYGLETNVQVAWISANESVAVVDDYGLISGVGPGQTTVAPSVGALTGPSVLVTVVATADEVGQVTISGPAGNLLAVGGSFQINLIVQTVEGIEIEGVDIAWFSGNTDVLSMSQEGLATGLANGVANVYAVVDGVQSNMLPIGVGNTERNGNFASANGYDTSGSARLYFSSGGDLMLELSSDFETEFALGTFVYLSNSTSGSTTAANGLEISGISTNGFKLYNVSAIDPSVGIDSFSHVIILCKPASLTFGSALML